MRVVAGTARGLRLVAPEGLDTRPTSDRVREALFNALGSLSAVEGAAVLDLYAGTGALGIEALSRGAARAVFVERDRRALAAVRTNLEHTGLAARAEVIAGDASAVLSSAAEPYDLALIDPPYAFDGWGDLLDGLAARGVSLAVLESDRPIDPGPGWRVVRQKQYGTTVVTIARRAPTPDQE